MTRQAFLHILWLIGVFQPVGLKVWIYTERTRLGEEARLRCQLLMPSDVFQVSWYKVLPDGDKMVAADNKYFGQRVEPEFSSRVGFKDASLQDSSIVIKEVTEEDGGCYRCLFSTYPEGSSNGTTCLKLYDGLTLSVHTERTVMAILGEEAQLRCQLLVPPDVVDVFQVSWYKVLPDGEKMVAADNKDFGQRVEPEFSSRVGFKDASLQDSSIVIKEVTEEDEGCYRCLFSTYPEGSSNGTTCLKLYELHGPFLHVRESNFPKEVYISCWATGQPGLTVAIRALQHKVLTLSTHSQDNKNDTVTVSSTVVLPHSDNINIEVECAVEMPFGVTKKGFVTIHESERPSAAKSFDVKHMAQKDVYRQTLINVLFVMAASVLALFLVGICLEYQNQSR